MSGKKFLQFLVLDSNRVAVSSCVPIQFLDTQDFLFQGFDV